MKRLLLFLALLLPATQPATALADPIVRSCTGNNCTLDIQTGSTLEVDAGATFSIFGTSLTANGAELNILDGATVTAAELNILDNAVAEVTYAVSAEFSNTITLTVDMRNAAGANVATHSAVIGWLSDAATCLGKVATAPTTGPTIVSSAGSYIPADDASAAKGNGFYTSDSTGNLNFTIANTGADVFYWCAVIPASGAVMKTIALTFE